MTTPVSDMVSRLTEGLVHPLGDFHQCQLCGFKSTDICEFRMWQECEVGGLEHPEPYHVFIVCQKNPDCQKQIDDHPRGYAQVPWGQGQPGHFMLLCGDCPNRNGVHCTHSNLKTNGGQGLLIQFDNPINALVSYHTEDGGMRCESFFPTPAGACEGHPTKKPQGQWA